MFTSIKNLFTRHQHSFDFEDVTTSYQFVRTEIKEAHSSGGFFGGTTFVYDGFWELVTDTQEMCQCGKHGKNSRKTVKVSTLSNGEELKIKLNDYGLHYGVGHPIASQTNRRVKCAMGMEAARRKLETILKKKYRFVNA